MKKIKRLGNEINEDKNIDSLEYSVPGQNAKRGKIILKDQNRYSYIFV